MKLHQQFQLSYIQESIQPTVQSLYDNLGTLTKNLEAASQRGTKTLLVVYFRGNGGLDLRCLETYALLQDGKAFPIEHLLGDLAKVKNSFVFGIVDCPRIRLEIQIEDGYNFKDDSTRNLILVFGCKMMQGLKQACGLTLLRSISRKNTEMNKSYVTLPEALLFMDR